MLSLGPSVGWEEHCGHVFWRKMSGLWVQESGYKERPANKLFLVSITDVKGVILGIFGLGPGPASINDW
jgi:hypothetical protein